MATNDIDAELEKEVAERIALMEDPSYEFPAALTKADWALIVTIPIVSLILLVIGEFL